jgi:hypothetical protein
LICALIAAFELVASEKILVHLPIKNHHHTHVVYKHIHHIVPHGKHEEAHPEHKEGKEDKEESKPPVKYAGSKTPQKLHTSFSASSKHKGPHAYVSVVQHPVPEKKHHH